MDGFSLIGTKISDELEKLQTRITNYKKELLYITDKLCDPRLPKGKRSKLEFRKKFLVTKGIPETDKRAWNHDMHF
jgi:hypothetical protein